MMEARGEQLPFFCMHGKSRNIKGKDGSGGTVREMFMRGLCSGAAEQNLFY